jgi:hypothetical protein
MQGSRLANTRFNRNAAYDLTLIRRQYCWRLSSEMTFLSAETRNARVRNRQRSCATDGEAFDKAKWKLFAPSNYEQIPSLGRHMKYGNLHLTACGA